MKSIYGTRVTRLAATKRDRMITAVDLVVIEYGGIDCSVIRITAFRRGHLPIFNFGGSSINSLRVSRSELVYLETWATRCEQYCHAMPRMDQYAALFLYPSVTMRSQKKASDRTHINTHIIVLSAIYTITSARINQICFEPD